MTGEYSTEDEVLKKLHDKATSLIKRHGNLQCTFQHIPREENDVADNLANKAIRDKENTVICNWPNINALMNRS
jgi:hypothetical protein